MLKLFWGLVAAVFIGLIVWFSLFNLQPRAIPKIKLSPFSSPQVAANSLALCLQEELRTSSLWLWGLNPADSYQKDVLLHFVTQPAGNFPVFDEIWLDNELGFDLPSATRKVNFKNEIGQLSQELAEKKSRRILVVTATPYAATFLPQGPAWTLARTQLPFFSLLTADFPRRREDESLMAFPCVLEHADNTGVGELGCQIQQLSRPLYRKKMTSGERVGFMDQVSGHDFLFVFAAEP